MGDAKFSTNHETKTNRIIFSTTAHELKQHILQFGTNVIESNKSTKILGVNLDEYYPTMTMTMTMKYCFNPDTNLIQNNFHYF